MTGLIGKVVVRADMRVVTGLRVGGSQGGLKIGGVDLNVITDAFNRPYIPGSSVKGKLRSLLERKLDVQFDAKGSHTCRTAEEFAGCDICKIFGTLGVERNETAVTLTRLIARDAVLDESSITTEMKNALDLQFTEVKTETAIDRVRGRAKEGSLRQVERVPAGAAFKDCELVFNVFEEADKGLLKQLFVGLELLEDDYLGGMGSRGYGKVKFENLRVWWNPSRDYEAGDVDLTKKAPVNGELRTPAEIVKDFDTLKARLV